MINFFRYMDGDAWNDMSSKYDDSVENNPDPIISGFLAEEIRIISDLCHKVIQPDKKYTVIEMGAGTGRVVFSLGPSLGDSVSYCGLDASKHMVRIAQKKQEKYDNSKISFVHHDVTDPCIADLFTDDSIKISMCLYNTIGVIPSEKRKQFFQNMLNLAGDKGLAIISAFNGDNFSFVAPKIYTPMKNMVTRIDKDSFDETLLAFKNSLGYYSQWFTKKQIQELLNSRLPPIPINVPYEGQERTFGHVFVNRPI